MPGSLLAGEALYQRLQTSQPHDRVVMKSRIGDIVRSTLRTLEFAKQDNFEVQLAGSGKNAKGWRIICLAIEVKFS